MASLVRIYFEMSNLYLPTFLSSPNSTPSATPRLNTTRSVPVSAGDTRFSVVRHKKYVTNGPDYIVPIDV
jgi:hypothetical protein